MRFDEGGCPSCTRISSRTVTARSAPLRSRSVRALPPARPPAPRAYLAARLSSVSTVSTPLPGRLSPPAGLAFEPLAAGDAVPTDHRCSSFVLGRRRRVPLHAAAVQGGSRHGMACGCASRGIAAQLRTTAAALSDAHRDAEANSKRALEVRVIVGTVVTTVCCVCPFAPLAPWCCCTLALRCLAISAGGGQVAGVRAPLCWSARCRRRAARGDRVSGAALSVSYVVR